MAGGNLQRNLMIKKEIKYKLIWMLFAIGVWGVLCFFVIPTLPAWPQSRKSEIAHRGSVKESSQKKPDLQFEEKTYDFGTVEKGTVVEHTFKLYNNGDGVLKTDRVKPSCGCTAALVSLKTVEPGESGEIKTSFDSKKFRGRITKTIDIHSNDPDEHIIQLVIKGIVLEPFLGIPFLKK